MALFARVTPRSNGRPSVLGFGSFRRACAPQPSTMDADSKEQKRRKIILSSLGAAIVVMDLAKELPSPASPVFGHASTLLKTIKVHLLFYYDGLRTHTHPGYHEQQNRLPRARAGLCRRMQSPSSGNGWEGNG